MLNPLSSCSYKLRLIVILFNSLKIPVRVGIKSGLFSIIIIRLILQPQPTISGAEARHLMPVKKLTKHRPKYPDIFLYPFRNPACSLCRGFKSFPLEFVYASHSICYLPFGCSGKFGVGVGMSLLLIMMIRSL